MRHRRRIFCLLVVLSLALYAGCSAGSSTPAPSGRITVVTSIFPLADVARQVGGEQVEVITLLPAGQSPHAFEPKPRQAESLAQADLLVRVGLGLDPWAERAAQAAGSRIPHTLVLADLLPDDARPQTQHESQHEPTEADHDHHHESGEDPHIWLDIPLMQRYADALAAVFSTLDPDHAAVFSARATDYRTALDTLDHEYRTRLADLPNRSFVSFHAAFGYLAARYDLHEISLMDASGAEFGPRRVEAAITFIREHKITTIFTEPGMPDDQLQAIARETGAKIARLDPLGNPDVPGCDSYLNLMRTNLDQLVQALKD